jgi:chloride channel protein, CIC family
MTAFEQTEADVLVVICCPEHRATIGTVSEAHVRRTYGERIGAAL